MAAPREIKARTAAAGRRTSSAAFVAATVLGTAALMSIAPQGTYAAPRPHGHKGTPRSDIGGAGDSAAECSALSGALEFDSKGHCSIWDFCQTLDWAESAALNNDGFAPLGDSESGGSDGFDAFLANDGSAAMLEHANAAFLDGFFATVTDDAALANLGFSSNSAFDPQGDDTSVMELMINSMADDLDDYAANHANDSSEGGNAGFLPSLEGDHGSLVTTAINKYVRVCKLLDHCGEFGTDGKYGKCAGSDRPTEEEAVGAADDAKLEDPGQPISDAGSWVDQAGATVQNALGSVSGAVSNGLTDLGLNSAIAQGASDLTGVAVDELGGGLVGTVTGVVGGALNLAGGVISTVTDGFSKLFDF